MNEKGEGSVINMRCWNLVKHIPVFLFTTIIETVSFDDAHLSL